MKKHLPKVVLGMSLLFSTGIASAQTDSLSQNIEDISLEDLMNVKIVSASRKEESSFEAPLSTCAITRKDIDMMGATSIPEALKICPGIIVREMSNGTYDVSIRGLEALPTHSYLINNSSILVMIDNRPVFNHLQGGTYWENLPVDLIDVERIEVVSGPSAPLYGPNAVTGVINIITRRPNKDGLYATGTFQNNVVGTNTSIGQLAIGYQPNAKFSIIASTNYNKRDRHDITMYNSDTSMYADKQGRFESNPDVILSRSDWKEEFKGRLRQSTQKFASNLFVNYKPTDRIMLSVSGGINNADALKSLTLNNNISVYNNRSYYGNAKLDAYNFGLQASYLTGNQVLTHQGPQYRYDYNTLDLYLDYNWKIAKNFSLRPAISYQSSTINDLPYTVEKNLPNGVFRNKATMTDMAASLKADYTFMDKFRIIGAVRADKFKSPDDIYISYQGMVNYKANDNNNFRFIAAKSNSGSFLVNSDVNLTINQGPGFEIDNVGSKNYKLLENYLYEVGYRAKVSKGFQVDVSMFNQTMKNFSTVVAQNIGFNLATLNVAINAKLDNLPQKVVQNGATVALNFLAFDGKLNIRPSVTYQEAMIHNYSPYYSKKEVDPVFNLDSTVLQKHTGSPNVYGSLYIGITPVKRLNIGVVMYALDKSRMYGIASTSTNQGYTQFPMLANISGKFTTSIKVSYKVVDRLNVFINCRNVFNNNKVEFYATDRIGALYMAGLTFEY